ncbi:hypothetical protein [Streptomyces sp. NPDC058307]|uniref:hypothetical protein n=1 Tax=Streptomyces sp. NPDC058307 TaxID=3346439 RepID=UPI0036E65A96
MPGTWLIGERSAKAGSRQETRSRPWRAVPLGHAERDGSGPTERDSLDELERLTATDGTADPVAEPSAEERRGMAAIAFDTDEWLQRTRTRTVQGGAGHSVLERVWTRPAAEAVTLPGGDPDDPARDVIPAVVSADITLRPVPDQHADDVMRQLRHGVAEHTRDGFEYNVPHRTSATAGERPPPCSPKPSTPPSSSTAPDCPRTNGTTPTRRSRSSHRSRAPRHSPTSSKTSPTVCTQDNTGQKESSDGPLTCPRAGGSAGVPAPW